MFVLRDVEGFTLFFQMHRNVDVHRNVVRVVFIIFHVATRKRPRRVDKFTLFVHQSQRTDTRRRTDHAVIRTEGRRGVYNTRTVFGRHEIADNHPECIRPLTDRFDFIAEVQKLLVADAFELCTRKRLALFDNLRLLFAAEPLPDQVLRHYHGDRCIGVRVIGFDFDILDFRTDGQCRIRG